MIISKNNHQSKKSRCQTAIAFNLAYKTQRKKREKEKIPIYRIAY